jgi:hypothetical protein
MVLFGSLYKSVLSVELIDRLAAILHNWPIKQSRTGWKGGFDEGAKAYFAKGIEIVGDHFLGFMWHKRD